MLLLVLALVWVAILVPIAVRYFRDSGTERSIESFYAEREMLSRQEHLVSPENYYERPEPPAVAQSDRARRPHLTVVHPNDTVGTLQARGTWDDWSRDYEYESDADVQRQRRDMNRYAAAYASVPGDRFGSSYNFPYEDRGAMRLRRRRIFVTLLLLCLAFTALTFVSKSPTLVNAAVGVWAALLSFVVLALVSLGLGYMGSSKVPDTYAHAVLEPAIQFSSRDDDYDDYGEVASEPQWRHDAVPRRAFG